MYISEPTDPTPLAVPGALKAVIYIGLAGTLLLGIWPQPVMHAVVAATTIFTHLEAAPVVGLLP
jgi:NADH-quinone oxidoreductase subunit N